MRNKTISVDLKIPTDNELSYVAGIIDGEGSIYIKTSNTKTPAITLSVSNTKLILLEKLKELFDVGSIHLKSSREDNRQNCYQWVVNGNAAYKLLKLVGPLLLLKKRQAEIAIEVYILGSIKDDGYLDKINALKEEITKLNQRGKNAINGNLGGKISTRKCSVDGCDSKHYGHGYCRVHYRWACESVTAKDLDFSKGRQCKGCENMLNAKARIDTLFCSKSCKMKWHRLEGCYSKQNERPAQVALQTIN